MLSMVTRESNILDRISNDTSQVLSLFCQTIINRFFPRITREKEIDEGERKCVRERGKRERERERERERVRGEKEIEGINAKKLRSKLYFV